MIFFNVCLHAAALRMSPALFEYIYRGRGIIHPHIFLILVHRYTFFNEYKKLLNRLKKFKKDHMLKSR